MISIHKHQSLNKPVVDRVGAMSTRRHLRIMTSKSRPVTLGTDQSSSPGFVITLGIVGPHRVDLVGALHTVLEEFPSLCMKSILQFVSPYIGRDKNTGGGGMPAGRR